MTRDEALTLILYAGEKWGKAAAVPTEKHLLNLRVDVWLDALADLDPSMVRSVLAAAQDEFPPNVAAIRRRCDEMVAGRPALPSWDEFWPWVRALARRCTDFLPERGGAAKVECPWPSLEGMVTADLLASWANDGMTEHDLEMVVQAHMRRLFDARTTRVIREGTSEVPALSKYRDQIADLAASKRLELGETA